VVFLSGSESVPIYQPILNTKKCICCRWNPVIKRGGLESSYQEGGLGSSYQKGGWDPVIKRGGLGSH
jgi:hypothetical protein